MLVYVWIAKMNNDFESSLIDLTHELYLIRSLLSVALIYAQCINPYQMLCIYAAKTLKSVFEVTSDVNLVAIDVDGYNVSRVSPGV